MKRMFLVLTLVAMLTAALLIGASAETTSGTCGENLTWKFENKVLTISGTGPMYDYGLAEAPWLKLSWHSLIVIEPGVTSIGSYAFAHFGGQIDIPESVKSIGEKAFAQSTFYLFFRGDPPEIAENAFMYARGNCMYIDGWEEEDLKAYGGNQKWDKAMLTLETGTKLVYSCNEQIKAEHLNCLASSTSPTYRHSRPYEITEFEAEPYNNSIPGEKQVKIKVQGREMTHTYWVTDGTNHLDAVKVTPLEPMSYRARALEPKPTVTAGSLTLVEGVHYTLSYKDNIEVGIAAVTVTGIGEWEGLSRTVPFEILKYDISKEWCSVSGATTSYSGIPFTPSFVVRVFRYYDEYGGKYVEDLKPGVDYVVCYENNINMGTAECRVVGIGNYCGSKITNLTIHNKNDTKYLQGNYIGQADGELDFEQYHYSEIIVSPGEFEGRIDHDKKHVANYELYKLVGEEAQLVDTKEYSNFASSASTTYKYDFSDVYEGAMDAGGEIYMLSYSWVDVNYAVYSGVCVIIVPAKVPDATQMVAEMAEGVGDFRYAYLTAYGLDGNVGNVTWTSSDPAVATVENGIVTMKTLGTVTFTGQYGDLTDSVTIMILPEDLTKAKVCNYDVKTGKVSVCYDGQLLEEGIDYTCCVSTRAGESEVTVTGINLFEGQLVQYFDENGLPTEHTHSFDTDCDTTCNYCDYTRETEHRYGANWRRDPENHWHGCTVCGDKIDLEAHVVTPEQPDVCTVCGPLKVAGDLDGSCEVNEDDVIYLLQHVLMPEDFPVDQSVDYDKNDTVDEDDVIYLLQHLLMPEDFPLS